MKKIRNCGVLLSFIFCIVCVFNAEAKPTPTITFAEKAYNFGNIHESNGSVTHVFTVTNTGDAPLVILEATASCGCTKPKFTARPIEPGRTGEISVTYNPEGRPGEFTKTIVVKTNDPKNKKVNLNIKGVVIPK